MGERMAEARDTDGNPTGPAPLIDVHRSLAHRPGRRHSLLVVMSMLALLLGMVFDHAGMAAGVPSANHPSAAEHATHHGTAHGHFACPEGQCDTSMHGEPGCCGVGHCAVTLAVADADLLQPPCPVAAGARPTTPVRYGLQFGIERPPKHA